MKQTTRQQQKLKTRETILETAARLFAQRGFGATTADIAAAAGLSHGTIFLHFPTREDLIDAVVDDFFGELNRETHAAASGSAGLEDLLRVHLAVLRAHEPLYRNLVAGLSALPHGTRAKLFAHQSTLSHHVAEALAREGEAVVPIPGHMHVNMWIALVHHYLVNGDMFAPGGSVLDRRGEELIAAYLTLIRRES